MIKVFKFIPKLLGFTLSFMVCFLLVGCGNDSEYGDETVIYIPGYELKYNGNIKFQSLPLKADDSDEIIALYQEVGESLNYRDSILVAKKYANGLGTNAFIQDNLDVLQLQGLTLSNVNKKQIRLEKDGETINIVLLRYQIIGGLISEIPQLYVSQLFIPEKDSIIMVSYITENSSDCASVSNMFERVKLI